MTYTRRDFGKIALAGLPAAGFLLDPACGIRGLAAGQAQFEVGRRPGRHERAVQLQGRQLHDCRRHHRAVPAAWRQRNGTARAAGRVVPGIARGCGGRGGGAARGRGGRGGGRQGAGDAPAAGGTRGEGAPAPAGGGERGGRGGGRAALTPEQQAAQRAAAEETRKWRMGVSLDKVKEFRRKFDDAGIGLQIIKWDGIFAHVGRRGRLLLSGVQGPWRHRAVDRDLDRGHEACRTVRRQAQDADRLPRPCDDVGSGVRDGALVREVQRGEPRPRAFHRRTE